MPWVRLPWTRSREDLNAYVRRAQRRLYFRPHYVYHFGRHIVANANVTMARYAWQEAKKTIGLGRDRAVRHSYAQSRRGSPSRQQGHRRGK